MAEVEMGDNVTETWPPRWTKPQFKATKRKTTKAARASKRRKLTKVENSEKQKVRDRDKVCRFPMCGCRMRGIALHVSHSKHRGMGGNPTGDRTQAPLMVLVCAARHRENRISIDRGTLRWRPFMSERLGNRIGTPGAYGPIVWEIKFNELPEKIQKMRRKSKDLIDGWLTFAYEWSEPGQFGLLDDDVLEWLASMEV